MRARLRTAAYFCEVVVLKFVLGQAASFDNPLAKQIRILENKLEKAVMKVNEVR